jgi:hypothetical protein
MVYQPSMMDMITSLLVVEILSNLSSHEDEKDSSGFFEVLKEHQSFLNDLSRVKKLKKYNNNSE